MRKKFELRSGANSFTLLEMLGVLAVMSILASVAVPPMLRSMQNAQSGNEDKNLEEIGRALCEAIKAEGQVPDPGALATATTSGNKGWVALAAPYCSMASEAIQYVYPGRTETERRFYILTINGATQTILSPTSYNVPSTGWITSVGGNWPGIQTSFLILISSSKPDYLLACPANGAATYSAWATGLAGPAAVNWAAKQWVKQVSNSVYLATNTQIVGTITTNNGSGMWTNKGQFLHVKVIPMTEVLSDVEIRSDAPTENIGYSTSSVTIFTISNSVTNAWFPRGTSIAVVRSNNTLNTNFFRPIQSKTSVLLDNTTNWVNKN
jgi:type II secretory pathway pseudopilin PulG